MRSALSVVIPAATACSEYSAPSPMSISVSDRTMWVDERCTIVTSAPFSHSAPQMSNAELFDPTTTHRLARVGVRAGVGGGVVLVAAEHVHARERRDGWAGRTSRSPGRAASGAARRVWPSRSTVTVHSPVGLVVGRALGLGVRPVVELHDLRVRLEPVGDLVLGREHRPVVGELQVRHVVVPDGVVQAERLVAAAPLVARPGALVDDDRGHAELAKPGAQADPGLAAADDQDVGLLGDPQLGRLLLATVQPAGALAASRRARAPLGRRPGPAAPRGP